MKGQRRLAGALLLMTALGCQGRQSPGQTAKVGEDVIYGHDSRLDLYQVNNPQVLALAHSTVALVKSQKIFENGDGTTTIQGQNFGNTFKMCSAEPFVDQDSAAFCSGSLIGHDTVLTAGHCVESPLDCSTLKVVFGFSVEQRGSLPRVIPSNDVYQCAEIIHREEDDNGADFALIRLDRPVTNHPPLALRQQGAVEVGDDLLVIGQPSGLPTKVASGAVRDISPSAYFVTNLDTYSGNSGSAVFNTNTGLIEGVLVRGEEDFAESSDFMTGKSCRVSSRCFEDGCRGEDVTRISTVLPFLGLGNSLLEQNLIKAFAGDDLSVSDNAATDVGVLHGSYSLSRLKAE